METTAKNRPKAKYKTGPSKSTRLRDETLLMSPADFSVSALQSEVQEIQGAIELLKKKLKSLTASSMPALVLQELHDPKSGRIDAQKIADFMGIPLKQLSEGLGLNYKAVHRTPSATGFQQALRPVKRSLELLHEFFGSAETIRVWLNTPHPDLGGQTALETILEGKAGAVSLILENAGNGTPV